MAVVLQTFRQLVYDHCSPRASLAAAGAAQAHSWTGPLAFDCFDQFLIPHSAAAAEQQIGAAEVLGVVTEARGLVQTPATEVVVVVARQPRKEERETSGLAVEEVGDPFVDRFRWMMLSTGP